MSSTRGGIPRFASLHAPFHKGAAGFTLVEVLVVVVIIALLASVVAVRIAPDARQSLREEASRLAAVLAHARDEAITTGAPLAWQGAGSGYRFVRRAADRTWQPLDRDTALRARELAPGVSLAAIETTAGGNGPAPVIVLAPTGLSEPYRITLALGAHRVRVSSDGVNAPVIEDLGL
jgi:general secretion pathway protein H